jgi:hypothetical protein
LDAKSDTPVVHLVKSRVPPRRGCCLLASNQKTEEIREAAIGLAFISSEYRLIYEQNFIKIWGISLLILACAVENGL